MKVFGLVLLVSLLFVEGAYSLLCFTCKNEKGTFSCLKISSCTTDEHYCLSETVTSLIEHKKRTISKSCATVCPLSSYISGTSSVNNRCCKYSLCNIFSNDGGLQASSLVLGLSVLFSLLYTLLPPSAFFILALPAPRS